MLCLFLHVFISACHSLVLIGERERAHLVIQGQKIPYRPGLCSTCFCTRKLSSAGFRRTPSPTMLCIQLVYKRLMAEHVLEECYFFFLLRIVAV